MGAENLEESFVHNVADAAQQMNVTNYLDYKEFLEDVYQLVKQSREKYSYDRFAEDLGFSKSNVLWLVVSGRRKLSPAASQKIAKALDLKKETRRYFLQLVAYCNSSNPEEREKRFIALIQIKQQTINSEEASDSLEYFSEWYHPVIRELIASTKIQKDVESLSAKLAFRVAPKEVRRSLELLQKLGLITFDEQTGEYSHTGEHVRPDRRVEEVAAISFHKKMAGMAKQAVTQIQPERRELNAITLCVDAQAIEKIKDCLNKICDEVFKIEDECQDPDQVVQVNLQMFPFTKE